VFKSLPRQGPGCAGATNHVFSLLPQVGKDAQILDVGCGSGTQTPDLAALTSGMITAVDNHQPFLDILAAKAEWAGLSGRIKPVCAPMDTLPFEPGQFDLIRSEGAISVIGFEKGLRTGKPFVKKGGCIVVSDAAWFVPNPPQELVQWWEKEGDIPGTGDRLREQVGNAGHHLLATYRLPEAGWWEHYFVPMLARIDALRKIHGSDPARAALPDSLVTEAQTCRKYRKYHGYTFFVMQNPPARASAAAGTLPAVR